MRIGIFGGTFDPIHLGHLIVAEQCREQAKLDRVWFVPSAHPPHKTERPVTRFEQRCEMIELAIAGHSAFRVERIEKELPAPSYTAETLAELHRRHPAEEFLLLMGADQLPDLSSWYQPKRVVEQAGMVVVPRPGIPVWTAEKLASTLGIDVSSVRLTTVDCPLIEIASREIRRFIAEERSVRYLIPRAVEEYIRDRRLYHGA